MAASRYLRFALLLCLSVARVCSFMPGSLLQASTRRTERTSGTYSGNSIAALDLATRRAGRIRNMNMMGMKTTVIRSDFKLPIGIAGVGLACTGLGYPGVGLPLSVVGGLLALQATRVAFEFDDEAMEVKIGNEDGTLDKGGENAFVGGESRWRYDTWTNWEVFPSESIPILMYFKETQTKPEGQIHFFPFIMNPGDLLTEIRARIPQIAK